MQPRDVQQMASTKMVDRELRKGDGTIQRAGAKPASNSAIRRRERRGIRQPRHSAASEGVVAIGLIGATDDDGDDDAVAVAVADDL